MWADTLGRFHGTGWDYNDGISDGSYMGVLVAQVGLTPLHEGVWLRHQYVQYRATAADAGKRIGIGLAVHAVLKPRQMFFDDLRLFDMTDARPLPPVEAPICGLDECLAPELTYVSNDWGIGESPLHMAAWQGSVLTAFDLLSTGTGAVDSLDQHGRSPLHLACYQGSVKISKYERERREMFEVTDRVASDMALWISLSHAPFVPPSAHPLRVLCDRHPIAGVLQTSAAALGSWRKSKHC